MIWFDRFMSGFLWIWGLFVVALFILLLVQLPFVFYGLLVFMFVVAASTGLGYLIEVVTKKRWEWEND